MSFSVCSRNRWLARFLAVSLRLQTRMVLGSSRTVLVGAHPNWNSLLSSKAQACFMGELPTLASFALEVPEELCPFTLTAVGSAVPADNAARTTRQQHALRTAHTTADDQKHD